MNTAPLPIDSTLILQWQREGVDYDQEFVAENQPDRSTTTLSDPTGDIEKSIMQMFNNDVIRILSCLILGCVVLVVLSRIFRDKFMYPTTHLSLDEAGDDDIYGIDFDGSLAIAERDRNYRLCIRLRYLKLLRFLQDHRVIQWMPGKTPRQYVEELPDDDFRSLSDIFVQVRYGNYPATAELDQNLRRGADEVQRRYTPQTNRKETQS